MQKQTVRYSPIAQSVERVTVNHDVVGSSPTWGAKKKSRSNDLLFLFVFLILYFNQSHYFVFTIFDICIILNTENNTGG